MNQNIYPNSALLDTDNTHYYALAEVLCHRTYEYA